MLVNSSQSTVRSAAQAGSEPPTAINIQAVNAAVRDAASVAPERRLFITRISLRLLVTPTRMDNFIKAKMTCRSQAVTSVFTLLISVDDACNRLLRSADQRLRFGRVVDIHDITPGNDVSIVTFRLRGDIGTQAKRQPRHVREVETTVLVDVSLDTSRIRGCPVGPSRP